MSASTKIIAALAVALASLLAVLGFGYEPWAAHQQAIGETRATTAYNLAIRSQKEEAGKLLATETEKTKAANQALADFRLQQEKDDVQNKSTIAGLAVRLRAAAGPAARLRDPHAAGCGGGGGGAPAADPARAEGGAADGAEADGFLSKQLTEFLLSQAADADQVNLAYTSCRADSLNLREMLK
ncbi:hypothetical protein [Polaromonas glacialis]|uniref:hypothetical protein n=1 Tax=Polaromonas glacialis TaxID=866564 RepID=UPI000A50CFFE|nr:hypothetical protein [Polaromonas glacialis]